MKKPEQGVPVHDLGRRMTMREFSENFGESAIALARRDMKSSFDPWERMPAIWTETMERGITRVLKPAQLKAVYALAKASADRRGLLLDGKPGTGKTLMSIAYALLMSQLHNTRKVLVVCPPHLAEKWSREITVSLSGGADIVMLNGADSVSNLLSLRGNSPDSGRLTFGIATYSRLRDGADWRVAAARRRGDYCCAGCGERLRGENDLSSLLFHSVKDVLSSPVADAVSRTGETIGKAAHPDQHYVQFTTPCNCPKCGEPLFQWKREREVDVKQRVSGVLTMMGADRSSSLRIMEAYELEYLAAEFARSPMQTASALAATGHLSHDKLSSVDAGRVAREFNSITWPLSDIVSRHMHGFWDLAVVDECHEALRDSGRGDAVRKITTSAKRVLGVSGTMNTGYAEDIPALLRLVAPEEKHPTGYFRRYGAQNRYIKTSKVISRRSGSRRESGSTRQPGLSQAAPLLHLTHRTAYVQFGEVNPDIEIRQEKVLVEMEPQLREVYSELEALAAESFRSGRHSAAKEIMRKLLAYTGTCWMAGEIAGLQLTLPAIYQPRERTRKENLVLEMCRESLSRGRKVLLYTSHVTTRPQLRRYENLLKLEHMRGKALVAKEIPTKNREAWIQNQMPFVDVLVANPETVKTGLDLDMYPTVIFTDVGTDPNTVQQALMRAVRFTQREPVEVSFIAYRDSAEERSVDFILQKIETMIAFGGETPHSLQDELEETILTGLKK